MGKARLSARWTREAVRSVNELLGGRVLGPGVASPHLGAVEAEGRTYLDLRGFPFAVRFEGTTLERVDFSGGGSDGRPGFTGVTVIDCRFVGTRLARSISGTLTGCRFDRASFTDIIGWPHTRFVRCSFDGASFRGGGLDKSAFEDCSFRGCKMLRTAFRDCRFDGCDFTDAVFRDGALGGSVFSRVRNNFKYADLDNYQIKHEFVADPDFPTVDLGETSVGRDTIFRAD